MTEWSLRPSRLGLETQASATARGWLRAAGPYLLALLVPGGVATALLGQLGAEQRRATESLAKQVQGLAAAVERLDERSRTTSEDVAGIRGRLEVIANLRGRLAEADSYLEQDRPALARAALREEGPTMGAPRPTVARRLIKRGDLVAYKLGERGQLRVNEHELERYVESQRVQTGDAPEPPHEVVEPNE